jgi:hypothetical protein
MITVKTDHHHRTNSLPSTRGGTRRPFGTCHLGHDSSGRLARTAMEFSMNVVRETRRFRPFLAISLTSRTLLASTGKSTPFAEEKEDLLEGVVHR